MTMRNLQRTIIIVLICAVLYLLGAEINAQFWAISSILALTICLEFLAYTSGMADGIEAYMRMSLEQRTRLEQLLKEDDLK